MPNPIVVDEIVCFVPTAQTQQPRSVLSSQVPAARSSESRVGSGPERVPPRWQRIPPAYMKCSTAASVSCPWSRQNDHVSKKIQTCPTKGRDLDTWVCSAKTNLSHSGMHHLSLLLSLRPLLSGLLRSMSAPVAIASTHSSPRKCTSGNQVLRLKFAAFANAGRRLASASGAPICLFPNADSGSSPSLRIIL